MTRRMRVCPHSENHDSQNRGFPPLPPPPPPVPQIMVRGPPGAIPEKIRIFSRTRPGPTRIPTYFGPFPNCLGQANPIISSVSKFPAGACRRISIWSREGPNQAKNFISEGPQFSAIFEPAMVYATHVFRGKVFVFLFSSENVHPRKTGMAVIPIWVDCLWLLVIF